MLQLQAGRDLKWLRQLLHDPIFVDGKRVIDIGCGEGRVLPQAEKEGAASCIGIDTDLGTLRKHWGANFTDLWHRIGLRQKIHSEVIHVKTCEKLPLKDSCGDGVMCSSIFPYVKDKLELLSEVIRILAPGGRAYIISANEYSQYIALNKGWVNAFLLTDAKNKPRLEHLKEITEDRELTHLKWRNEKDPDVAKFGSLIDIGVEGHVDKEELEIVGMKVTLVNPYVVFGKILHKCPKIELHRTGLGFILEKSEKFNKKDASKASSLIKKAQKCHLLNIDLKEQDKLRPLAAILTVLDSKILK